MYQDTLVAATGQARKLYLGMFILVGGLCVMAAGLFPRVHDYVGLFEVLLFGGFALFFTGGGVLLLGIRCPVCRCAFIWREARKLEFGDWLDRAFQTKTCPACGFSGGTVPPVDERARPA